MLRGFGAGAAALAGARVLAACGTEPVAPQTAEQTVDRSEEDPRLVFDNWPSYIDKKQGTRPTLEAFERDSGIRVQYNEVINDNAEYFAKISPQLANGQAVGTDLACLSDWMVSQMISLGWLQELDKANLPTVAEELDPALANPSFDPERRYSVPWQSGITGIAFDRKQVPGGVVSLDQLLTDPALAGKVSLFATMQESLPILAGAEGGIETFTEADLEMALAKVEQAADSGHIRRFTGNDYVADLASGDLAAALAWSGDIFQLQLDNPNIEFVVAQEGGELWSDNLVVLALAERKANAEALMDYYYDPRVAAELVAWVNYVCPVPAARDEMGDFAPELADDPLIFPQPGDLENVAPTRDLTPEEDQRFSREWNAVVS